MKGWHFLQVDCCLQFGNRDRVEVGKWISVEGDLRMCRWGLHASKRITDALRYAPGARICRVELRGDLQHQDDKSVGRERKVEWWVDGEGLLRDFARRCALDVIHLWDAPEVVVRYLKTGDESLKDASWAAAKDAAKGAAKAAAKGAAKDASWAAAKAAAWAAAWDAARAAQNRRLTSMVVAAHKRGDV